ncbi:MAG TPA: K(+)-transporting ATPase subunit C [Hanamia sp.]|nr:K(+)-transporting ATPase subunit C [Hanamia sp.]
MKENIFPAIRLTLVCLVSFSGIYTLIVFGVAQFTNNHGKGEVIRQDNKTYYTNVGQKFTDDKYFYSRPSAVAYNAAGAGASNKGPSNPYYLKDVQARIDTFLVHNPGISKTTIPSDLVTASGSGLDPDISVQAAIVQVKRISKIRGIAEGNLQQLIITNTEKPLLGFLGTERINVLKLNIALDNLK